MSDMDAAVSEFLIESDENLNHVERDLINLEGTPDESTLSSIFRAIHTIKGTCAFLGYSKLESLAHTGETLLSLVRDGELSLTPEMTSVLLAMVDAIRQMLECIEQSGGDGEDEFVELKARLTALQSRDPQPIASEELSTVVPQSAVSPTEESRGSDPVQSDPSLDEAVSEFLIESDENLSQVERDLVDLEEHPDEQTLSSIFRAIHTIKGTCAFLGYVRLESLAHTGETLLSLIRDGELVLTPSRTSALLTMVDAIRQMLQSIEQHKHDGTDDFAELKAQLTALQSDAEASSSAPVSTLSEPESTGSDDSPTGMPSAECLPADVSAPSSSFLSPGTPQVEFESKSDPKTLAPGEAKGPSAAESSIRVDVGLLDKLMNMVGELVLTRNQILQCTGTQDDAGLLASSQRLSLITSELQEGIMKTRMQQIGNVWSKFPRVVRDLAISCGKEIRLEMEGKDTELDKTLIEAIKDPLTHLVRNSVDHGIEPPDVREQRGKAREGILLLRAYHEGGQVNIEITDDGGGINAQRVAETAVKRGVVTQEQVSRMPERELLNLIFLPGFSTAAKVTNVSGRGVGMDVVRTNIEKIGGTIDISTKLGEGTTFKLKVPLTLAIIPALIVTTSGEQFAIPQVSLLELVRLEGEMIRKSIENIHGAPVCRLRGHLLPLVYLHEVMQLTPSACHGEDDSEVVNIVVLQADGNRFGLVVEDINDTEEIVVKPLSKQLKGIPVLAGATIMGDGRVALILDVMGLAHRVGLAVESGEHMPGDQLDGRNMEGSGSRKALLIIQVGDRGQVAIPLDMVARLEEIPVSSLEVAGGQEVIQYRQEILPVIRLSSVLSTHGCASSCEQETIQVVVISQGDRQVGLAVDRIVDIVQEEVKAKTTSAQPGILCSAVVQERVTDLLDVQAVVQQCRLAPFKEAYQEVVGV
ncbi:MAG: Hpt domain-containing protein [Nitrospirales bacterium]|nr:Hpt domain-containing protein [Nitrospira sp.]MDR4502308.1 Hpt domain-containing protein [Nitrospirales bacterium]